MAATGRGLHAIRAGNSPSSARGSAVPAARRTACQVRAHPAAVPTTHAMATAANGQCASLRGPPNDVLKKVGYRLRGSSASGSWHAVATRSSPCSKRATSPRARRANAAQSPSVAATAAQPTMPAAVPPMVMCGATRTDTSEAAAPQKCATNAAPSTVSASARRRSPSRRSRADPTTHSAACPTTSHSAAVSGAVGGGSCCNSRRDSHAIAGSDATSSTWCAPSRRRAAPSPVPAARATVQAEVADSAAAANSSRYTARKSPALLAPCHVSWPAVGSG